MPGPAHYPAMRILMTKLFVRARFRRVRNALPVVFTGALICTNAFAQSPGLVAAYSFDEGSGTSLSDSSGGGNAGAISNATWTSSGKFGKALSFNGSNSTVTIQHSAALNLTSGMTLEAWVNPSSIPNKWTDVMVKARDLYYMEATSTFSGRPAGGTIISSGYIEAIAPSPLVANVWSHLALTFDGSQLRFYVNGVLASTASRSTNLNTSTQPLSIGGSTSTNQYFSGMIDEIRIYNVPRTASQIQADMNAPIGAGTPVLSSGCDLNGDGAVNQTDVQLGVDMTIGAKPCSASLVGAGVCNVALVQRVVNGALGGECGTPVVIPPTVPPPAQPRTVALTWVASTSSGVTGYNVFRGSNSGGPYNLITPSKVSGTSYTDTTVVGGNTYYYVVTAVNSSNLSSVNSNQASAAIPGL